MRILHSGNDHVCSRFAWTFTEAARRRGPSFDGRQHLPLRCVSTNRCGDHSSLAKRRQVVSRSVKDVKEEVVILEPERYELAARLPYSFELNRRDFVRGVGGGILLVSMIARTAAQQESGGARRGGGQMERMPQEVGAWLHIAEDGAVTAYTGKVEFGQDIRTSLAQVVADELRLPVTSIRMVMGDTDLTPFDMGTFGSLTTRIMSPQLRKAAARARELLIDLAAETLKADRSTLALSNGKVTASGSGKALSFGEITRGRKLTEKIEAEAVPSTPDKWVVAGSLHKRQTRVQSLPGRITTLQI